MSVNKQGLKEGLLFQSDDDRFILGEAPFVFHKKPIRGFYLPGFFFENPRPWIEARRLVFLKRAELLERFVNSLPKASAERKVFARKRSAAGAGREATYPQAGQSPRDKDPWKDSAFREGRSAGKSAAAEPCKNDETFFRKSANALSPLSALSSLQEGAAVPAGAGRQKPSFTEFFRIFMEIKREIRTGALQKAVPVFFERLKMNINPINLLQAALRKSRPSDGFLYGFWDENGGIFGLTPELLFSKSGGQGELAALAATAPHPGPSLFRDPKELKEHALVLQGIEESLPKLFSEESRSLQEKPFFNIKHLRAVLRGRLKGDFENICQALHPTPALGGFPKKLARERPASLPGQKQRGLFGSPFGFFDGKESGICLVALRCLQWLGGAGRCGSVFIGSGCGITDQSRAQKEYREIFLKRETVKGLFFS